MSLRGPMRHSHLRQVSAASSDSLDSPSLGAHKETDRSIPDERNAQQSSAVLNGHQCTIWVHDEAFSKEEILFNQDAFSDAGVKTGDIIEILPIRPPGEAHPVKPEHSNKLFQDNHDEASSNRHPKADSKFRTPLQTRCLFLAKPLPQEIKSRHPKLEISVTSSVASTFGFKNRTHVFLSIVDRAQCSASHVDISFRDQYMVRSDMWRLAMTELADKIVYKGQKLLFMGTMKATVKNIFIRGKKVLSGYFSPHTIPVFRSESAKYVLFIQMSREMWDFDSEGSGDILFSRVINGFLPELFKRWANVEARHLVTIVLFTRVEYATSTNGGPLSLSSESLKDASNPNPFPSRDFYRVVVNDMASGHWTTILDELKKNFRTFLRDVSIFRPEDGDTPTPSGAEMIQERRPVTIAGRPSTALRGNILEAIHLASAHLAFDHIDRDMVHTGTSIIVITPGSGVFEVSYESLASTTEALTNRGIAIDLVCLSPMPLHSVPLFKYRQPVQRHSNAAFGDMRGGGHSPEMRQSFASFGSKAPRRLSRPTIHDPISGAVVKGHMAPEPGEWNYGIPHWLDISYWNPDTYRETRGFLKKDPNAPIPFTLTRQSKAFVPRLRMYEIQMMGVMESEQSNISIPYLLEGQCPSRIPNPRYSFSSSSFTPSRASYKPNSPYSVRFSDSLRPEPFLQNMTNPRGMMLSGPRRQQSALSWMDRYDETAFKPFPRQRQPQKTSKSKRPSEPEVQSSGMHERMSARSISRLREHETNPSNQGYSTRAIPKRPDSSLHVPNSPTAVKNVPPHKPAPKTPPTDRTSRISRTINFALRGLGNVPPRAQASTEVKVEHAEALPMSNQRTSMATHSDSGSVNSQSLSNTASASTVTDPPSRPTSPQKHGQDSAVTPTRPISIKAPSKKPSEDAELPGRAEHMESCSSTATEIPLRESTHGTEEQSKRPAPKFGMALSTSSQDGPSRQSPGRTLSPWVRSVNPCNTSRKALRDTSWFGRWQHAYPRPPHVAVVKWKSLKSPAILPLTTEEFPTSDELSSEYLQTPYRVSPNDDAEGNDAPRTRGVLLREMISLRLSHGFQIVIGKDVAEVSGHYALESLNVFDSDSLESNGAALFLSKGNAIHRLVCIEAAGVEVTRFTHRNASALSSEKSSNPIYFPAMRTILNPEYEIKDIVLDSTTGEYNWNYADNYIAGHRDYLVNPTQQLHFWRVRYVLIPMHLPATSQRHLQSFNEDDEEEIHLLGIRQLTHIWQRHKYIPPEEKRFETGKKFVNPLNIMYQTRNQSEVVTAELDRVLLTDPGLDNPPAQLLPESELLERSSINLSSLAQMIQGDKGVRMMDRRWHWRLHYNCFIGFEFTTWLLQNFRDIDSREEAVEFGNELMKHGVLQHVERRHNFRDGNYFYQICSEYRVPRPESRGSWFPQKRSEKLAPAIPADDSAKESPSSSHARSVSAEDKVPPTPNTLSRSKNKVAIMLSKSMKYDVDPRKRSHRPEIIDLHYDRLHNPENCFHIELSWMNTTAKLIEDAVQSWASTAEKFGLKLVQVPVSEACSISTTQPFRKPYRVELKMPPPKAPVQPLGNGPSFAQPGTSDLFYFQKAILRKFDFVLDFEPRSAFPPDVEVTYSWGKPEYKYAQYIHRSGSVLAQITDEGDFLILANRLVSTRGAVSRDLSRHDRAEQHRARPNVHDIPERTSPRQSPYARPVPEASPGSPKTQPSIDTGNLYRAPEHILAGLMEFCDDTAKLEQFYAESQARPVSTKVGPAPTAVTDANIPSLELPASVVSHHISPPAVLGSRNSYFGSASPKARPTSDGKPSPRSGGPFMPLT